MTKNIQNLLDGCRNAIAMIKKATSEKVKKVRNDLELHCLRVQQNVHPVDSRYRNQAVANLMIATQAMIELLADLGHAGASASLDLLKHRVYVGGNRLVKIVEIAPERHPAEYRLLQTTTGGKLWLDILNGTLEECTKVAQVYVEIGFDLETA